MSLGIRSVPFADYSSQLPTAVCDLSNTSAMNYNAMAFPSIHLSFAHSSALNSLSLRSMSYLIWNQISLVMPSRALRVSVRAIQPIGQEGGSESARDRSTAPLELEPSTWATSGGSEEGKNRVPSTMEIGNTCKCVQLICKRKRRSARRGSLAFIEERKSIGELEADASSSAIGIHISLRSVLRFHVNLVICRHAAAAAFPPRRTAFGRIHYRVQWMPIDRLSHRHPKRWNGKHKHRHTRTAERGLGAHAILSFLSATCSAAHRTNDKQNWFVWQRNEIMLKTPLISSLGRRVHKAAPDELSFSLIKFFCRFLRSPSPRLAQSWPRSPFLNRRLRHTRPELIPCRESNGRIARSSDSKSPTIFTIDQTLQIGHVDAIKPTKNAKHENCQLRLSLHSA